MTARVIQFPAPAPVVPPRPPGITDEDYIDLLVGPEVAALAADMLAQSRRAQIAAAS